MILVWCLSLICWIVDSEKMIFLIFMCFRMVNQHKNKMSVSSWLQGKWLFK